MTPVSELREEAISVMASADCLFERAAVEAALERMALAINHDMAGLEQKPG